MLIHRHFWNVCTLTDHITRHQHVPSQLQFKNDIEIPDNEFILSLKCRYYMCLEWIQRPFLHYRIHQLSNLHDDRTDDIAYGIARSYSKTCSTLILLCSRHQRHDAIWFIMRRSLCCALLLLAGAKKWLTGIGWEKDLEVAVQTLSKWEPEAVDLQWATKLLRSIRKPHSRYVTGGRC